jgi:hypothetical protein
MSIAAGIVSMGAYLPGHRLSSQRKTQLVNYLSNETLLLEEYVGQINKDGQLPGKFETNYDGWEKQPWFETWLKHLPPQETG